MTSHTASPSTSTSLPSIRLAATSDDLTALTKIINESYCIGEKGIFVDTEEQPFLRHQHEEIETMVMAGHLFVLVSNEKEDQQVWKREIFLAYSRHSSPAFDNLVAFNCVLEWLA